jgi:excisionase family DNA binding protein
MIKSTVLPEGIEHNALQLGEVARRLNCSRRFLEKQIAAGRLRVVRLSPRCVRVRPTDLAAYLDSNAV